MPLIVLKLCDGKRDTVEKAHFEKCPFPFPYLYILRLLTALKLIASFSTNAYRVVEQTSPEGA